MNEPRFDICSELHAMNDFGGNPRDGYSRSRTYTAECYRLARGEKCNRRGRCLIARFAPKAEK